VRKVLIIFVVLVVLVLGAGSYQIFRPVPSLTLQTTLPASYRVPGTLSIQWPTTGEAAISVLDVGVMGQSGGSAAIPIASLAKIMTALLVLHDHPLATGQNGTLLTVSTADMQIYQADVANGDSVLKVAKGEQLSERQLLEGLLLPSGDNVATMLAKWDAGSVDAFVQKMNAESQKLGMLHTHYADPAGVNAASVSNALDQLQVAQAAMHIAVFRHVVDMAQATLPVSGVVYNVDSEVGKNGIVGIKTGSTPRAGGNFVFASYKSIGTKKVLIVGDVLAQGGISSLTTALNHAVTLSNEAARAIESVQFPLAQTVSDATILVPWGNNEQIPSSGTVGLVGWPGMMIQSKLKTNVLGDKLSNHGVLGDIQITSGAETRQIPLVAAKAIQGPGFLWKLKRLPSFL